MIQLYLYKKERNFPSAFCFAYRGTSKTSSLFIFINERIKTSIPLYKYTILNNGGECVCTYTHTHTLNYSLVMDPELLICVVNKPYISALSTGHNPSESTIVLRNYIFEPFGKLPM